MPFNLKFSRLPRATQVIYLIIKNQVDKRAIIDYNTGHVLYKERSHPYQLRTLTGAEAQRIFDELYIEV